MAGKTVIQGVHVEWRETNGEKSRVLLPTLRRGWESATEIAVISDDFELVRFLPGKAVVEVSRKLIPAVPCTLGEAERVREILGILGLEELWELWDENAMDETPQQLILKEQVDACVESRQEKGLFLTCMMLKENAKANRVRKKQMELFLRHLLCLAPSSSLPPKRVLQLLLAFVRANLPVCCERGTMIVHSHQSLSIFVDNPPIAFDFDPSCISHISYKSTPSCILSTNNAHRILSLIQTTLQLREQIHDFALLPVPKLPQPLLHIRKQIGTLSVIYPSISHTRDGRFTPPRILQQRLRVRTLFWKQLETATKHRQKSG